MKDKLLPEYYTNGNRLMQVCKDKGWVPASLVEIYETSAVLCTMRRNVWIVDQILSFEPFEEALQALLEVEDSNNRYILMNIIKYVTFTMDMR